MPLRDGYGVHTGGGHPQGVPLRMDTGCTRGEGTYEMDDDVIYTGEGTHKGCPYGMDSGCTRGEGTHKGCPYVPLRAATRRRR